MKNIINNRLSQWVMSFFALATLVACDNFLEEDARALITEQYLDTEAGVEDAVNAAYYNNRLWYGKERGYNLTINGTDIIMRGAGNRATALANYDGALQGTNGDIGGSWGDFYRAINSCNLAIESVPVSPLNDNLKLIREGEARFLRAFYYYHMVETWGDVHFTLESTKGVEIEANRTPVAQIYDQIFIDMNFAVANLPDTQDDYGRVTKSAAYAIRARMHLTRGNYTEAIADANWVINNGKSLSGNDVELLDTYADLFDIGNIENDEVIWAVNYTVDPILNEGGPRNGGHQGHLFFLMPYDQISGMDRDVDNGRPFRRYMPTRFWLELFDESMDSRYLATFKEVWFANDASEVSGVFPGLQNGDSLIVATKKVIPTDDPLRTRLHVFDINDSYEADGSPVRRDRYVSIRKFDDPLRETLTTQSGRRDGLVTRLAEMYLIAAEAEMLGGSMGNAVDAINTLRRRAANDGFETDMEITAADLNIDFILDERARELGMEAQLRWFDLKRTGKLIERVRLHNPDGRDNIQDFHALRPIPQSQRDNTFNDYPQNPGYN